ncbi:MAG TPA: hypothetical protein VFC59_01000, partial [Cryobacterium sp.]|nr:hypothetical protein [Cryobacterium sp.]
AGTGAFLLLHDGGGSGAQTTDTAQPAAAPAPATGDSVGGATVSSDGSAAEVDSFLKDVERLIKKAGHGRNGIGTATAGYRGGYMSRSRAAAMINGVIDNRTTVKQQLSSLSVPDNYDARAVRSAFVKAMQHSIDADYHYLDWVNGSGSENAAYPDNGLAATWKAKFVHLYNRLARAHGLRSDWVVKDI